MKLIKVTKHEGHNLNTSQEVYLVLSDNPVEAARKHFSRLKGRARYFTGEVIDVDLDRIKSGKMYRCDGCDREVKILYKTNSGWLCGECKYDEEEEDRYNGFA